MRVHVYAHARRNFNIFIDNTRYCGYDIGRQLNTRLCASGVSALTTYADRACGRYITRLVGVLDVIGRYFYLLVVMGFFCIFIAVKRELI